MKYLNRSIAKYLKDLGAKISAPGGGSAAALAAAMAAALLEMSCHFTLGKKKYKAFQRRAKAILGKSSALKKRLSALCDEDVAAYSGGDFKKAIDIPAEVCFLSVDVLRYALELLKGGNKNLASDAALSAFLAESAFSSAFLYVKINVRRQRHEKKKKRTARLLAQLQALSSDVRRMRKNAEVSVGCFARR